MKIKIIMTIMLISIPKLKLITNQAAGNNIGTNSKDRRSNTSRLASININ